MTNRHFHTLKLAKIIKRTELASTLEFVVPAELQDLYTFKAGQYLTFKTVVNGQELRRSYSINSASGIDEPLQVTVKKVQDGKVSNHFLDNLKVGDELEVMPPLGQFTLPEVKTSKSYFYAAGSGITPIFGLIKTLLITDDTSSVNLQYGNYEREQVIFYDEFAALQVKYSHRFELKHHYTNAKPLPSGKGFFGKLFNKKDAPQVELDYEAGDFTAEKLIAFSKSQSDFSVSNHYICGPGQMIPQLEQALLNLGVPQNLIHHEYFAAAKDESLASDDIVENAEAISASTSNGAVKLTVKLDGDTEILELPAGETVLRACIEEGLSVPYACESGVCSTCKARCVSGEVKMRSNSVLSDSEIEQGFILTCQSEAVSSELVVDYDDV